MACCQKYFEVHVIVWCRHATSHYLNQYWPRSEMPNGVTRPQWVYKFTKFILFVYQGNLAQVAITTPIFSTKVSARVAQVAIATTLKLWYFSIKHYKPIVPQSYMHIVFLHLQYSIPTDLLQHSILQPHNAMCPVVDTYNMQQQLPRHHPRQPSTSVG